MFFSLLLGVLDRKTEGLVEMETVEGEEVRALPWHSSSPSHSGWMMIFSTPSLTSLVSTGEGRASRWWSPNPTRKSSAAFLTSAALF